VLERREPWTQTYDCHSAELTRQFRLQVLPLGGPGLLLIHTLVVEVPISGENAPPLGLAPYLSPVGLVRQCSNCRRTQRSISPNVWDWVPQLVLETPDYVSHGICTSCLNNTTAGSRQRYRVLVKSH
jgi:hypothetical protein